LVFLGLSFRAVLRPFVLSYVAVWKWSQHLPGFRKPYNYKSRRICGLWLSWTRNSLQAEKFLKTLVRLYGRHPVWTDGAPWYSDACKRLKLEHYMYNGPIQ
jgi:hypothetical protein